MTGLNSYQCYALRVATDDRDVAHRRAHKGSARTDQHNFIVVADLDRTNCPTIALGRLDCDYSLPAATLDREVFDFAVRLPKPFSVADNNIPSPTIASAMTSCPGRQLDATNTCGTAPHRPDIFFLEANRLAMTRDQHDLALAVRNSDVQPVDRHVPQIDSDDAA